MVKKVELFDLVDGTVLVRTNLTAIEAIANDPKRYTLTRPPVWPPVPSAGADDAREVSPPASHGNAAPAGDQSAAHPPGAHPPGGHPPDEPGPLCQINGIGVKLEKRFNFHGINTLEDLAKLDAMFVLNRLELVGYSKERVQKWIDQANDILTAPPAPPEALPNGPAPVVDTTPAPLTPAPESEKAADVDPPKG